MKLNHVGLAVATVAAALAFGRARAADPTPTDDSAKAGYEHTMAGGMDEAQPLRSDSASERARLPEGTGAGNSKSDAETKDRLSSQSRDAVTYPLPDSDPEIQKLLSE